MVIPVLVATFILVFASTIIPITKNYNDGKASNVQGVSIGENVEIVSDKGQTALVSERVGALTSYPISLDPDTKKVTVNTPIGTKEINVSPQKAVNNTLAAYVMSYVTGEKVKNSLASIPSLVNVELKGGVLGYNIEGQKEHKVLGLIPLKTGVKAFVSAENGQVVESRQSLLGRILNKVAP